MNKRSVFQPAYIGRALHIWEANKYQIEELLQDALEAGASEITLTIDVPDNAPARKRISVCHTAVLPVSTAFEVAQADQHNFTPLHTAATWEAACAWMVTNDKVLPRNHHWEIYGVGGPLFSRSVNLFKWQRPPIPQDVPPTHRKEPPADRYALPKRP